MEKIAPTSLAQSWDNVGLLAGDRNARVRRMLLTIDVTAAVVDEAIRERVDLLLAYHPPIFQAIKSLVASGRVGTGMEALVFRCIRDGVGIYATHTALDAADGGTNDVIAGLCGVERTEPLEYVDDPKVDECKLVVFVPPEQLDRVATAMFNAGAGHIGDYSHCSYRTAGEGTFLGGESTKPAVGRRGRLEVVSEVRLESIVGAKDLPAVVRAMREAHPYEEPAFDIYSLQGRPVKGIGRMGRLPRRVTLGELARNLERATRAAGVQIVGRPNHRVEKAVIVVGAAGSLPLRLGLGPDDVIITGEIRHHDALTMGRIGCAAIALGHWASERPVLDSLARRLESLLPGVQISISRQDRDPFQPAGRVRGS